MVNVNVVPSVHRYYRDHSLSSSNSNSNSRERDVSVGRDRSSSNNYGHYGSFTPHQPISLAPTTSNIQVQTETLRNMVDLPASGSTRELSVARVSKRSIGNDSSSSPHAHTPTPPPRNHSHSQLNQVYTASTSSSCSTSLHNPHPNHGGDMPSSRRPSFPSNGLPVLALA
ncbi:hypothetical protein VKT23_009673 [Stygiomarasmius scandens]|uniref:Uncharacterized protein n=1 Tax=Marasmiellus scandens TaxID=2682957 RepID=A0ABR1JFI1_9AGAR